MRMHRHGVRADSKIFRRMREDRQNLFIEVFFQHVQKKYTMIGSLFQKYQLKGHLSFKFVLLDCFSYRNDKNLKELV